MVGAALRTRSGRVFTGVHLEATVGRIAICAEAIAIGRAATEAGDTEIDTIVAVYHPSDRANADIRVVAPCGMCRELISDYSSDAMVIMPAKAGGTKKRSIQDLLPDKYVRTEIAE